MKTHFSPVITKSKEFLHYPVIVKAISQGINFILTFLRNDSDLLSLLLAKLKADSLDSHIALTFGSKYRTDYKKYSGPGFQLPSSFSSQNFLKNNILSFFKPLKEEIKAPVEVKLWTCGQCKKEYPETMERFKKFNSEFCSIDCLRSHFK